MPSRVTQWLLRCNNHTDHLPPPRSRCIGLIEQRLHLDGLAGAGALDSGDAGQHRNRAGAGVRPLPKRIGRPPPKQQPLHRGVAAPGTSDVLARAVRTVQVPDGERVYVWLAGEARASRAVRRHLRRELGWPQADFYTCGYWQIEAEKWNARYEQVADEVQAKAREVEQKVGDDQGAYLDALDDIYESVGL